MIRPSLRQPARRRAALTMTALVMATGAMIAATAVPASAAGWVAQTTPNPAGTTFSELIAVSCSSTTNCVAVGDQQPDASESLALGEHWNGSTWSQQTAVLPSTALSDNFQGISCPTTTFCIAVGSLQPTATTGPTYVTFAEEWT
jgi:hypothetical protein